MARPTARHKEIAIRTALGASRCALFQLLTESILLALMGGALGIVLALWASIFGGRQPEDIPRLADAGIDSHVLIFSLAISLLTE